MKSALALFGFLRLELVQDSKSAEQAALRQHVTTSFYITSLWWFLRFLVFCHGICSGFDCIEQGVKMIWMMFCLQFLKYYCRKLTGFTSFLGWRVWSCRFLNCAFLLTEYLVGSLDNFPSRQICLRKYVKTWLHKSLYCIKRNYIFRYFWLGGSHWKRDCSYCCCYCPAPHAWSLYIPYLLPSKEADQARLK